MIILVLSLISGLLHQRSMATTPEKKSFFRSMKVFEPGTYGKECHSATITELSNGELLAAWWCGSYEGATDVAIWGSRFQKNTANWGYASILADIPGRFEGNPVLFKIPDGRIWLFFVAYVPEAAGMVQTMLSESKDLGRTWFGPNKFITSPGLRTKNHPIVMPNRKILLPLFDELTGQSVFLLSENLGETWEMSRFIVSDPPNAQPTVISRGNSHLYALMRAWHDDPAKRFLWQSESSDYGRTWSVPTYSSIPTVSSAVEMISLKNGHVIVAYNDGKGRERTPLSLGLSLDQGRTWAYKRNLDEGPGSFSYPSLLQSRDGNIHILYSYNRKYIKHVEISEDWIRNES
jgi:predicted neuraminidase